MVEVGFFLLLLIGTHLLSVHCKFNKGPLIRCLSSSPRLTIFNQGKSFCSLKSQRKISTTIPYSGLLVLFESLKDRRHSSGLLFQVFIKAANWIWKWGRGCSNKENLFLSHLNVILSPLSGRHFKRDAFWNHFWMMTLVLCLTPGVLHNAILVCCYIAYWPPPLRLQWVS